MKVIPEERIASAVEELAVRISVDLPEDVEAALAAALERESSPRAAYALEMIVENARIAREERLPICQDTGMFHLFLERGAGVMLPENLQEVVDRGLRSATLRVPLRSSIVDDPLFERSNRGDNTPLLVHVEEGGKPGRIRLTLLAKGGGSENATKLYMILPSSGREGLKEVVMQAVKEKAAHACPPVVLGIGAGSDAQGSVELALRSLLRPLGERHHRAEISKLEEELLAEINGTGIGAGGLGGDITALDVHLEEAPAHIACLPVGVVMCCHALRRGSTEV